MSVRLDSDPDCAERSSDEVVELTIEARPRGVGSFTVARLLPAAKRRMIGPFIFIDRLGPVTIAPGEGYGIAAHPHIGLSTVTYFLAGENVHRDSLGTVQVIRPGDVNIMTAGRGVVHSERPEPAWRERGGVVDAIQIWLALPLANEDDAPSFAHHARVALPAITPAPGVRGRLIAGEAFGATSQLRHPSAPLLADLELDAGAAVQLRPDVEERGVLVLEGSVVIGRETIAANRLAALRAGALVAVRAAEPSRILVIGGPHLGERLMDWNFVASTRDRLERARDAWKAQQFPKIPGDDREFVPYPEPRR
jgi:redox-sensitive bicupin YhaK (pirin superfamily)